MEKDNFTWLKKHVDTVVVLGALLSSVLWINGKFSEVDNKIFEVKQDVAKLDKEIGIIKTVLIMQHIMPQDLAQKEEQK